jgi:hypothetical protein
MKNEKKNLVGVSRTLLVAVSCLYSCVVICIFVVFYI